VLRALLHCHRFQMVMWRRYNVIKNEDLDEYHRRKAERFMIAQKEKFGMETMDAMVDRDQVSPLFFLKKEQNHSWVGAVVGAIWWQGQRVDSEP
jgi:hypothetical protein